MTVTAVQTSYGFPSVAAFAGMLADAPYPPDVATMRNDEASAEIAFGRAVKFGSTTDRQSAKLPDSENAVIAGIAVHGHHYSPDMDLGTVGLKPTTVFGALRRGRIWVVSEDGNNVGDRGWVRGVAAGDPEFLGGIANADDSTDTVNTTNQIVFLTSATAGQLAIVEVDFTNKPGI